ncbi:MAG TPA: hypothetical protein VKA46_40670 [Gemmataceae bacterium]|nr:hypothetical protein [Gemmataceae bacterium]
MSGQWLGLLCLSLLAVLATLQFLAGLYCWYVLERTTPRYLFWTIDWADVLVRLEWEFGITFCPDDFRHLERQQPPDITAGELFAIVRRKVWDAGRPAPADSWRRLSQALGEALNVPAPSLLCESRLRADLGME